MIIRSQNGEVLLNSANVSAYWIRGTVNKVGFEVAANDGETLATYETITEAHASLDNLFKALSNERFTNQTSYQM